MNHYTYIISYISGKYYIGVRSCKCLPNEDIKYLGSSKSTPDKSYVKKKKIIKIFNSRKEAINHEIHLHAKHNVSKNEYYYNQVKQTSTGFDTTGMAFKRTQEHNEKIKKALTGRKRSPEECAAISKAKLGHTHTQHTQEFKDMVSRIHKGKTVSKESITKMISTRRKNNSYIVKPETKEKISNSLKNNPPWASKVLFTDENMNQVEYISIESCSRSTGVKACTIKGRLNRSMTTHKNGWAIQYLNTKQVRTNDSN